MKKGKNRKRVQDKKQRAQAQVLKAKKPRRFPPHYVPPWADPLDHRLPGSFESNS